MDGSLAAIFVIASLTDMALNDCPTGCLAQSDAPSRLSFQIAATEFQERIDGTEMYLGYDLGTAYGPFQPTFGASLNNEGSVWVGAGAKFTTPLIEGTPLFIEASLMPGFQVHGQGPDIGGNLHFRSAIGFGYAFENGGTLAISYDHRSNADTLDLNPGLETIAIRYAFVWD